MEEKVWAGVDTGKGFHYWAHVVDASGEALLSRGVENDEAALTGLIDEALRLSEDVVWATDQPGGAAPRCCWRCCGSGTSRSSTSPA